FPNGSVPSSTNPREEMTQLLKHIAKAMHKTDLKRGMFAKLRKSRSETISRLLSKHVSPLSLALAPNSELEALRMYLYSSCADQSNSRKRRCKALGSIILVAI